MRLNVCHTLLAAAPLIATLVACGGGATAPPGGRTLDAIAEGYVRLGLELGTHDPDYVDAYYGPEDWRTTAEAAPRPLAEIRQAAEGLLADLAALPVAEGAEELVRLRHEYLNRQISSLAARARMLAGERLPFDQESLALYDAAAPHHDEATFEVVLDELRQRLAGEGFTEGSISERLAAFRRDFEIPADRLDAVFQAAIQACREAAAAHLELPEGESFTVEYVTGQPWSAYNWYLGDYRSLIQVNTDLPVTIDRAVDLACHEGYPGHHVYNALLEKHLVDDRGWVEYSIYPLFSPRSLISEGSANFGIDMAFPGDQRVAFERDVLYPLAGLDPARAALYHEVLELAQGLSYAGNEAARRYLDGEIDAEAAAEWLVRHAGSSPERAAQRVRFFDRYRSYVINYNLGKDLVREYLEARGGTADQPERRWRLFGELLSSPRLPSGLR